MFHLQMQANDELRRRPIMRGEFERMVQVGILGDDDRVELLRGELVVMSPVGRRHAWSVAKLMRFLVVQLPDWLVQPQATLRMWDHSAPEPDVAVIPLGPVERLAESCALVVEVADSSLRRDVSLKAALYAEAAIPVYWLVDLDARVVHVHSEPANGEYRRVEQHGVGDVLGLDGHPAVAIPVDDIV